MALLNARYAAANTPHSPIWIWLTRNIWSRSFYVAPIGLSFLVVVVLRMARPGELDWRAFIITWFVSTPVGFLLWIYAWNATGAGNGHITASVGTTALLGWCAWHRGLYLALVETKLIKGVTLCLLSGTATVAVKTIIGSSTGPITLAMIAAFTGTALPLGVLLGVKVNALLRRFGGRFVTPIWRLMNQPIPLGHIMAFPANIGSGAAVNSKSRISREGCDLNLET